MNNNAITREILMQIAVEIAHEYGGNLTVRQLYYQFIARGIIPPEMLEGKGAAQRVYKRVVGAVKKARLFGLMPFDYIVDRTRTCHPSLAFTDKVDVEEALDVSKWQIKRLPDWNLERDRWLYQPKYVTVGVEKEALVGVFEGPCEELGVGLFVFRGYSSISALHQLCEHLERAEHADEAILLYFGDHDPDGWEIPRAALRTLPAIAEAAGMDLPPVRLERVALNMEQIRQYNPPPFEAKVFSSRYRGYNEEHQTDKAWELDALPPNVLESLIRDGVSKHFDASIDHQNQTLVDELRDEMRGIMCTPEWIEEALS